MLLVGLEALPAGELPLFCMAARGYELRLV